MTDIEALLSVDAGRVPPGAVAFFAGDADVGERRTYAALAALSGVAAAACACIGAGRFLTALLVLSGAALAVLATPNAPAEEERRVKRPVLVVTDVALIVRDEWGLKVWRFEDLCGVTATVHDYRPHLLLVDRRGSRYPLDCLRFKNGDRLRDLITKRLAARDTAAA